MENAILLVAVLGIVTAVILLVWGVVHYLIPLLAVGILVLLVAVAVALVLAAVLGIGPPGDRFVQTLHEPAQVAETSTIHRDRGADGILLGSPTYFADVSSELKALCSDLLDHAFEGTAL